MKFRSASKEDTSQILTLLPKDSILQDQALLSKLLDSKDTISQIIEVEGTIIAVALAFKKSLLEKNKTLQNTEPIKTLLTKIRYDFVYFDTFELHQDYQNKGYERMLMYSFLDECKSKTIIAGTKENTESDLLKFNQLQSMQFDEFDTITIDEKNEKTTYLLFEKDQ